MFLEISFQLTKYKIQIIFFVNYKTLIIFDAFKYIKIKIYYNITLLDNKKRINLYIKCVKDKCITYSIDTYKILKS